MIDIIHETSVIEGFVEPSRRQRWLALQKTQRKRAKFIAALSSFPDFDSSVIRPLAPSEQVASVVEVILKRFGAHDTCYIISENARIDARQLSLRKALDETVGFRMGTIISCLPGKLAYYEAEFVNTGCILLNPARVK